MTDSPNEHSKYKLLLKLKGLSENPTITFPLSVEYKHGDFSKSSVVSAVPASQGGFKFSDCLVAKETIKFLKNDQALLTVKTPVRFLFSTLIGYFVFLLGFEWSLCYSHSVLIQWIHCVSRCIRCRFDYLYYTFCEPTLLAFEASTSTSLAGHQFLASLLYLAPILLVLCSASCCAHFASSVHGRPMNASLLPETNIYSVSESV